MKTTTFIATLAIFSTMLIASCSKDDNDNRTDDKPASALVSKIEVSDGRTITFEYDLQNRLTKAKAHSYDEEDGWYNLATSYSRSGNTVTILSDNRQYDCVLNAEGQMVSATVSFYSLDITDMYTYDREGCLTGIEAYYQGHSDWDQTYRITWSNGCAVKSQEEASTNDYLGVQFTNIENKINIDLCELMFGGICRSELSNELYLRSAGLIGKSDKYLPSEYAYHDDSSTFENESCTFEYTLDDNGIPIVIKCAETYGGKTSNYTVELTYK